MFTLKNQWTENKERWYSIQCTFSRAYWWNKIKNSNCHGNQAAMTKQTWKYIHFWLMVAASINWEGGCQFLAPTLGNFLDNLNAENWCTAWLSVIVLQLSRLLSSCLSEVTEEVLRRISNNETPEFISLFEFAGGPTGFGCELLNFAFLGWLEFVWSYRMERGITWECSKT